jgi:AAA family ATP:ADP antiporter
MAFIPLSDEEKLHGKAAIDGIGARLGKTSSSLIYQLLLVALPTISACTPFIGILLVGVIVACIGCIISLGKQIESLSLRAG